MMQEANISFPIEKKKKKKKRTNILHSEWSCMKNLKNCLKIDISGSN